MAGQILRNMRLEGTTDGSGDVTINGESSVFGWLYAVEWVVGTFATGVDAVLSIQSTPSGVAHTILTLTDANSNKWYYPREAEHDNTGTATGGKVFPLIVGKPRLVVAQGGSAKTGFAVLYYYV